ncbi:hypothetical protein B9Z55_025063 [Caenorhabditis nigoni]|uniref:BZIP domain-containing protein n=1 Tax=Caenorhabditis nigoni TaxID=1611254 RepID=A0A2G5SWQ1_9PELO|nr:hypothetical protein B9Z55_025063 [Caenorhabditis nigoni]
MDFDSSQLGPDIDEFLNNPDFPAHFDELELDSLLYEESASQESSPSSSFGFSDENAGFRSRDGGSLGDSSSSDSSPPLSCANFTENDQEMWEFGFQNPNPFENFDQRFDQSYQHQEEVFDNQHNEYQEVQYDQEVPYDQEIFDDQQIQYVEEEKMQPRFQQRPNKIIAILPRPQQVKRVITKPVHKIYRVRESELQQPVQQHHPAYRAVPVAHPSPRAPPPTVRYSNNLPIQPKQGQLTRIVPAGVPAQTVSPQKREAKQPGFTQDQRKIRNRMYAQASRIRKREAEEEMKRTIEELSNENEVLRNENALLKQRLAYYEPEASICEYSPMEKRSQGRKKMMAAGTVLMMFGLFAVISPFNVENTLHVKPQIIAIPNETVMMARHSRVLIAEEAPPVSKLPHHTVHNYPNSTQNDCEMYKLNATETRRVNSEIERWVQVHSFDNVPIQHSGGLFNKEAMRKFNEARKQKNPVAFGPETLQAKKKSEKAAQRLRERTWLQLDQLKTANKIAVKNEKMENKSQDIAKIASIVRQKRDTLYIMALQDYVLLPSLTKGGNTIPKLSLLLPSVPMNGTIQDQVAIPGNPLCQNTS